MAAEEVCGDANLVQLILVNCATPTQLASAARTCSLWLSITQQSDGSAQGTNGAWSAVCDKNWRGVLWFRIKELERSGFRTILTSMAYDTCQQLSMCPAENKVFHHQLEHNGPHFPKPYVPHGHPVRVNGEPFVLSAEQEELATHFARAKMEHRDMDIMASGCFWEAWVSTLEETGEGRALLECLHPGPRGYKEQGKACFRPTNFHPTYFVLLQVDFSAIVAHLQSEDARRLDATVEEQRALLQAERAPFETAMVDGLPFKIATDSRSVIEPPGFEWYSRFQWRPRVMPEDVTLNLSMDAPVPPVPDMGDGIDHAWGAIVSDPTAKWIAHYRSNTESSYFSSRFVWLLGPVEKVD